jgi:hypothetical protein
MPWYDPFNFGWFGGNRQPIDLDRSPPPARLTAPSGKPRTASQSDYGVSAVAASVYPCCPDVPAGDYPVWRAMDADPALTLSRAVIVSAFREADKSYEAREGTPEAWVELVQDSIDPLWQEYIRECPDALSMGWKPFEVVPGRRDGRTVIADIKPLAQELSTVLTIRGALAGLRNTNGVDRKSVDLPLSRSLVVTVDGLNRYYYGRPWHENCRKAWWDKIQTLVALARLNRKASGIQPKVWYPPATDEATNHTNENIAKDLVKSYMNGEGVVMPNVTGALTPDLAADYRNIAGMAEAALWKLEIEDFGNTGAQSAALLDQLRYHNAELSRGWHVPERAAQEAVTAGSRADSETHGDVALKMSQLVYNDFCAALQGPVDAILVENFGEKAKGAVTVKAGRLSDVYAEGDWKVIDAALAKPDILAVLLEQIDVDAIVTRRGIPKNKATLTITEALKKLREQREKQQQAQIDAAANGGRVNGAGANGKAFPRMQAMSRGVELLGRIMGGEDGHDDDDR